MSLVGLSLTLILALFFSLEMLGALVVGRVLDSDILVLLSLLFLSGLTILLSRDRASFLALRKTRTRVSRISSKLDFILTRLPRYSLLFLSYFLSALLILPLMSDTTLARYYLIGALASYIPVLLAPILRRLFLTR